jgi:hypothetical protein
MVLHGFFLSWKTFDLGTNLVDDKITGTQYIVHTAERWRYL